MAAGRNAARPAAALVGLVVNCCLGSVPALAQLGGSEFGLPAAPPFLTPFSSQPLPGLQTPAVPTPTQPPAPGSPSPTFRYQSNTPPGMGVVPTPGFLVVPRLGLYEEFNDNIFQSETDRRWDLLTIISPGVSVTADTPRLNLNLNYSPSYVRYIRTPQEDHFGQNLLATGSAILVPDELFVNARAFATVGAVNGGFSGIGFGAPTVGNAGFSPGGLSLSKNNRTQVVSSGITPYLVHRFADFGSARVGINLTQSYSSNSSGRLLNSPNGPSINQQTGEFIAQFQSGSDWGRVLDIATIDAKQSTGTGAFSGSRQDTINNQLGYFINRNFLAFVEFGAESLYFNTVPRTNINDGTWAVGATVTPNADSQLTLSYGHKNGFNSFQALGRYAVTSRTNLTVSYLTGLSTDLQQIEQQLALTSVNPLGNPVNTLTGAPTSILSNLSPLNGTLYQNHTLTVTATTLLDRNTISLSLQRQNRVAVAGTVTGPGINNTSTSGTALWTHEVSERSSFTGSASYGVQTLQSGINQNENFFSAAALYRYKFTDTLTGTASYMFYDRHSNVAGLSFYEDIALVGITKEF